MNYYNTQRTVKDTVIIGNQTFAVEATWREEEDGEQKVDVRIAGEGGRVMTYLGLDGGGLQQFAEVFLTVEQMIRVAAVSADQVLDA